MNDDKGYVSAALPSADAPPSEEKPGDSFKADRATVRRAVKRLSRAKARNAKHPVPERVDARGIKSR